MRLAALALVVACCAVACSDGGADGDGAAPTSTAAGPVVAPDASCPGFRGTTAALASTGERPAALLVGARAEAVGCLDRVTFEFESLGDGTPPGYTVGYRDVGTDPLLGETGNPITVPGNAFLVVSIAPAASTDPRVEDRPATYRGNLRLAYDDVNHLEAVEKLPDVLGGVQWVIGLDGPRPFLVDSAKDPARVSVYVG